MKFFLLLILFYLLGSCGAFSQINCNNWLSVSNFLDGVTIGDLDITGNTITVEALFNRTEPYLGSPSYAGDLVSKHLDPTDCNYLLRPGHAEITTTNGFFATPEGCEIKLNKTYHAAMVYDGKTLKFYRNGFLMGQVNATGNLITNDWLTKIGETAGPNPDNTQFKGFINEVRIWNVAKTQAEIRANMNSSLSNPSSQLGLLAYFSFNNLLNRQGNATWNGSVVGSAVINSTNTSCTFVADSCEVIGGGGGGGVNCRVNAGRDTAVCSQSQLQLNANGAVSYVWLPATGLSNATIANPVATVNSTVTYIVTGTTSAGCTSKDTITINAVPVPVIKATNDTSFCGAGSVALNAIGAANYQWLPATGLSNPAISNPVASVSANSTYIVTGTTNGCASKDTVVINVLPVPLVHTSNDTTFCNSGFQVVQLNTFGAQNYIWSPAIGLSNATIANPVATVSATVTYVVTGIANNGCSAKDTITINVTAKPFVKASNDTTICSSIFNSTSIQLNAGGAAKYQWFPSTGLSNPAISNPTATISANTTYIVTGTTSTGCWANDTVIINVLDKPVISLNNDTIICKSGSVQLSASGGKSYQWFPETNLNNAGIANPVATPSESITYFVTVTSANNCSSKDSINISVKTSGVFDVNPKNAAVCPASSVQLTASGGDTYTWQPANSLSNTAISNPIANPDSATTYTVLIKDSYCGIDTTLSVQVNINPKPIITVSKDGDFSCSKNIVHLNASGGTSYTWTPSAGLNNPNISNPVATVPANTTFYVSAINNEGCTTNDSIKVNFTGTGNLKAFQLPTAFTPNGDRLNDCFGIAKWGSVQVIQMEIYNRWGEVIFKGKNYSDCWDGSFKGLPQQAGNFPYIIKVKTGCGIVEKKGSVILLR